MSKALIRSAFAALGMDLRRLRHPLWLQHLDIKTVIDIGANTGQFASHMRRLLPNVQIYSFEPIDDAFDRLQANFRHDERFQAFQLAMGATRGPTVMFRNDFTPASSLLRLGATHRENFPHAASEQSITVNLITLDDAATDMRLEPEILVKMDVQGYEAKVISGGQMVLARTKVIIVEVSYESLYVEQSLFGDIFSALGDLGFDYHGNLEQVLSPIDGRPLQGDAIFLRRDRTRSP